MVYETKQKLKFSVICVTFNAAKTLDDTIKSVLNQTYSNFEFIIVDGASNDGTLSLVKKYPVIRFVSEPDKGIYDAMNKSLNMALGDFVYFIGSDDVLYDNHVLENVANNIDDINYIYYGNVRFGNTSHIHWGKFNKWKWGITNISHQAIFYPQRIYKNYKYDLRYKIFADYIYNLDLLRNCERFKYIDIIIARYDLNGASSNTKDEQFNKDIGPLRKHVVGILPTYFGFFYRFLLKIKHSYLD